MSCASEKTKKSAEFIAIDDLLTQLNANEQFNGGVLVAKNNDVILKKSYGYANFETAQGLNEQTVFHTSSISKTFTAVAVLQLIGQGKLSFEDKLTDFFPKLPYPDVTIKHLLNHTSGLYPYNPLFKNKWDPTKIATNSDVIEMYENERPKLFFKAGTAFSYCNVGYVFLASIVEKISGLSFSEYLRQHIFTPLEMNHTQTYTFLNKDRIENYANEYILDPFSGTNQKVIDLPSQKEEYYLNGKLGDDRVSSTLEDVWKWNRALFKNNFVSPKLQQLAVTSSIVEIPKDKRHSKFDVGYGFQLDSLDAYGKVIYHNGGSPGLKARFHYYPDIELTLILYSNAHSKYTEKIKNAILAIMTAQSYKLPKKSIADEVIKGSNQNNSMISETIRQYRKDTVNYYLSESELNRIAGVFWDGEETDKGLEILKLNVKYFPNSVNAIYTLGEGYMEMGDTEKALIHFNQAKELLLKKPEKERNERFLEHVKQMIENNRVKK